ncbi:MAG: hypothetical protein RBT80_03230 [Candidatus Vecturithrix sp.]|jgi:hypothetical protein|nr:hypothetical protein [Candidatus Vecturithrix sp.]
MERGCAVLVFLTVGLNSPGHQWPVSKPKQAEARSDQFRRALQRPSALRLALERQMTFLRFS